MTRFINIFLGSFIAIFIINISPTSAEGFEGLTELGISSNVTGMAVGGTGLLGLYNVNTVKSGSSTKLNIEVPSSPTITIENVYIYWSGVWWSNISKDEYETLPGCVDNTSRNIIVDGATIIGTQIGCYREDGNSGWRHMSKTLKAEITGMGRIGKGKNTLDISMPTGSMKMMAASVLVLYSDSSVTNSPTVKVFEGIDFGYDSKLFTNQFSDPANEKHFITPIVMQIPQSQEPRNVQTYISIFDAGVGRHDITTISSGGTSRLVLYDTYQDADGDTLDILAPTRQTLDPREPVSPAFTIPPGAIDLTYTFDSNCGPARCNPQAGRSPSSLGIMFVGAVIGGTSQVTVPKTKRVLIVR